MQRYKKNDKQPTFNNQNWEKIIIINDNSRKIIINMDFIVKKLLVPLPPIY